MESNPPLPAPNDLAATWAFLENGIDQIMNRLEEGLSYKRYMDLYTYPFYKYLLQCIIYFKHLWMVCVTLIVITLLKIL